MIEETGKAAIIHPTGTGKSFIAFKLAEDNLESIVCWLSPSEYIYNTQKENLVAAGSQVPDNIYFLTYAKLMYMSEEEIESINPSFIVLDEFHRCGAQQWGKGIKTLLTMHSAASVIGLSATNIRYLDNCRDMGDELFEGNIASEMTLGEAIVRGILRAPKYVLSVFKYQKNLDKYKSRIRRAKNKVVRDEAQKYFEALRRMLEQSEGLDEVFNKHIPDKTGKYIIFCSNIEHLAIMQQEAKSWFAKIDTSPYIYTVYSQDPYASESFKYFKENDDNTHLRLLFCIDALNEGIHVDDISGVILLRPTVSPIIFKQQIGRAFSASMKNDAVIFDIVLNIENLYNIDSIQEEMQTVISYYRSLGKDDDIARNQFKIVDELKDCRVLFEKLNNTLTASWDLMYEKAKEYHQRYGNLEIPYRYKTDEGYSLGRWILTQKRVKTGQQFGSLTKERVAKLDAIDMVWDTYRDLSWKRNFAAAKKYYNTFGDLNIAALYITESGMKLGSWIANLRFWKRNNVQQRYLSDKRIKDLNKIGMVWDVADSLWQQYYEECVKYSKANGNLDIPSTYITENGLRLGAWINNIRASFRDDKASYKLVKEQIDALDELGMLWDTLNERLWKKGYLEAVNYKNSFDNLDIPSTYKTDSGYYLGRWLRQQKTNKNLPENRKKLLNNIGITWSKPDSWQQRYAVVKEYYKKNGNLNIPADYVANGIWINKWLNEQRQIYIGNRKGKTLTEEQISLLESIGMIWENKKHIEWSLIWDEQFREAEKYYKQNGDLNVPVGYKSENGKRLDLWIKRQKTYHRNRKLAPNQIKSLELLNVSWGNKEPWEEGFIHAKKYYQRNGNLLAPTNYTCKNDYKLGIWLSNQRSGYLNKYKRLNKEQINRLEAIGMVWNIFDAYWEEGYMHATEYFKAYGNLLVKQAYKTQNGYSLGEWIASQRKKNILGKLSKEAMTRLNQIGMDWLSPSAREWENHFEHLKIFYKKNQHLEIPIDYLDKSGFRLGRWLWRIRTGKAKLKTNGENGNQIERLNSLGVLWK